MLTIFSTPKAFEGHNGVIQRNAIRSWTLLSPACEVMLVGSEPGVEHVARELGVRHVPQVARNRHGTPLVNSIFEQAESRASGDVLAFVNSDIILTDDFTRAAGAIAFPRFLMVGQRWDVQIDGELQMTEPGWQTHLEEYVRATGRFQSPAGVDYFVFTRGLFGEIPPLAIGRFFWDNWLVYAARKEGIPVVDATAAVMAVHQEHDYAHIADQWDSPRQCAEAMRNAELGNAGKWYSHRDATWRLRRSPGGSRGEIETVRNWSWLLKPCVRMARRLGERAGLRRECRPKQPSSRKEFNLDLSVIGLGKLGSPMAACFAAKGYRVIGVDLNEHYVRMINHGKAQVFEPGLNELLSRADGRLIATDDLEHAVKHSNVTFIIVPTPSRSDGAFSVNTVLSVAEEIGKVLRDKNTRHLVVLTSTVMPGDTEKYLKAALEKSSGKRCPEDFGLCYSPEFIALGSVIRDYLNPDFVLIGESDPESGRTLEKLYKTVCENNPPVARMNFANAELTKLGLNALVTTKISYANMLAEICEHLEGGDVDVVTSALGLDTRIGPKYLTGSTGYGGPCFPRDSIAVATLARRLGMVAWGPEATDKVNNRQVPRVAELVGLHLPTGGRVGILGVAYKPDTNVVERAQGLELAQKLLAQDIPVVIYDPCAMETAKQHLSGKVSFVESAAECASQVDVLVVCTPCAEFREIDPADLGRAKSRPTVIDCWRLLPRDRLSEVCNYVALGTSDVAKTSAAAERDKSGPLVGRAA